MHGADKSAPEGGRPRIEWSQVKLEVRFQRDLSNNKRLTVGDWQFDVKIRRSFQIPKQERTKFNSSSM